MPTLIVAFVNGRGNKESEQVRKRTAFYSLSRSHMVRCWTFESHAGCQTFVNIIDRILQLAAACI